MQTPSRVLKLLCVGNLLWLGLCDQSSAETLPDALALAYASNPSLQAQRAQLRATDEEYAQAESGYRPSISVSESYTYSYLEVPPASQTTTNGTGGAIAVTQPLYTGGRVARAIDVAHADILAGRAALRHTETQILLNVIQVYVEVRRDREALHIGDSEIEMLSNQLDQTNAQFAAGDATLTDIAQAEARLAEARAQHAATQADLEAATASYAAVVGQAPGDLAPQPPLTAMLPATVDAAFDAADAANPDLAQARMSELTASARVAEAKALNRPTLGLTGSVGYTTGAVVVDGQLLNPGVNGGPFSNLAPNATIMATATIPIYTGGLNSSQIRQAAEQDGAARLSVEVVRRQVTQSVAVAWDHLLGERQSITADEERVKADTLARDGVREEQKAGFRTVLDVLNSEHEVAASMLALVNAQYDEYLATASVLATIGSLDADELLPTEHHYDPAANYRKVTHAMVWTPWARAIDSIDRLGAPQPPGPN
jgi:outer membrane protein